MRLLFRPICVTAVAAAAAGCGLSFERSSEILDRRIIAMSADPCEVIVDGSVPATVHVKALVVDVKVPDAPVAFEWRVCSEALKLGYDTVKGRCDEANADTLVATGTAPLEATEADIPVPASVVPTVGAIAAQGTGIPVYVTAQLRIADGDRFIYAVKRIVFSPPIPAGKKANAIPRLAGLLYEGEPWEAGKPVRIKLGDCEKPIESYNPKSIGDTLVTCERKITPVFDETQAEPYRVSTFEKDADGKPIVVELSERLRFGWFADDGAFSNQNTQMPFSIQPERADPFSTKWREPKEKPQRMRLWVVVRDGRGGESWLQREAVFE